MIRRCTLVATLGLVLMSFGVGFAWAGDDDEAAYDTPPKMIDSTMVAPKYPEEGRKNAVAGRVLVKALISVEGEVAEMEIMEGIEDYPAFGEAAMAALGQWRFEPAELDGKPVPAEVVVPFQFKLDGDKGGEKK